MWDAMGSGVVFGQRFATWEAAYPKTTPDPFRPIPPRNVWPGAYLAESLLAGPPIEVDPDFGACD